jgi:hypothetical protein
MLTLSGFNGVIELKREPLVEFLCRPWSILEFNLIESLGVLADRFALDLPIGGFVNFEDIGTFEY